MYKRRAPRTCHSQHTQRRSQPRKPKDRDRQASTIKNFFSPRSLSYFLTWMICCAGERPVQNALQVGLKAPVESKGSILTEAEIKVHSEASSSQIHLTLSSYLQALLPEAHLWIRSSSGTSPPWRDEAGKLHAQVAGHLMSPLMRFTASFRHSHQRRASRFTNRLLDSHELCGDTQWHTYCTFVVGSIPATPPWKSTSRIYHEQS